MNTAQTMNTANAPTVHRVLSYTPAHILRSMTLYEFVMRYRVYAAMDTVHIVGPLVHINISHDLAALSHHEAWAVIRRYRIHPLGLLYAFSERTPPFIDVAPCASEPAYMSRARIVSVVRSDNVVLVPLHDRYREATLLCPRSDGSRSRIAVVHRRYVYQHQEDMVPIDELDPGLYHDTQSRDTFYIDTNGYTIIFQPKDNNTADADFLAQYARQLMADRRMGPADHDICIVPNLRGIVVRGRYVDSVDRLMAVLDECGLEKPENTTVHVAGRD